MVENIYKILNEGPRFRQFVVTPQVSYQIIKKKRSPQLEKFIRPVYAAVIFKCHTPTANFSLPILLLQQTRCDLSSRISFFYKTYVYFSFTDYATYYFFIYLLSCNCYTTIHRLIVTRSSCYIIERTEIVVSTNLNVF